MKRLVIVRHGKAVPYGYENDFDRDLRDKGKTDAALVSNELKGRNIVPDLIVSSPAKRALKTAHIFAQNLGYPLNKIQEERGIYEGLTTNDFIEMIQQLPEEAATVFVFGHNPAIYYFAANLLSIDLNSDMPTTSTVGIDFDTDSWKTVEARSGKLAFHLMPRLLR